MFLLFFYNIDIAVKFTSFFLFFASAAQTRTANIVFMKEYTQSEEKKARRHLPVSVARFTSQTKLKKYYRQNERIKICAMARPEED